MTVIVCRHAPVRGGWWYTAAGVVRKGRCVHCAQPIVKTSTGEGWSPWRLDLRPRRARRRR